MRTMKAAVFITPGRIVLDEKPVPAVGPGEALIRITTTTNCGTDVHILNIPTHHFATGTTLIVSKDSMT